MGTTKISVKVGSKRLSMKTWLCYRPLTSRLVQSCSFHTSQQKFTIQNQGLSIVPELLSRLEKFVTIKRQCERLTQSLLF